MRSTWLSYISFIAFDILYHQGRPIATMSTMLNCDHDLIVMLLHIRRQCKVYVNDLLAWKVSTSQSALHSTQLYHRRWGPCLRFLRVLRYLVLAAGS